MQKPTKNWYADWFDTPFYHTLYQDRDYKEARFFMDNLTNYLKLPENASILDLACGKGRHSIYLNTLGFDVVGVDLSINNITYAKKFENSSLHFDRHDMSKPYPKKFDAVLNLFTSFGYFDRDEDNLNTICAIKQALNNDGTGVIDFLNVNYVKEHLIPKETKVMDNIGFQITRSIKNGYIFKHIDFEFDNKPYHFTERVKLLAYEDFITYFKRAGVTLIDTFGDYKLNAYNKQHSERLILVFK
jgi:SAM-dependent methyltransferase